MGLVRAGRFVTIVLLVLAGVGALARPERSLAQPDPASARALDAYRAMQRYLYDPRAGLYQGASNRHAWPFSQALSATVAVAEVPGAPPTIARAVSSRLRALRAYWSPRLRPPAYTTNPGGGDVFYDDNEWISLELVRRSRVTGDGRLLARARQIFRLVQRGWDPDSRHSCPGGVFWTRSQRVDHRNTVTSAPGAQLALDLYAVTRGPSYLSWGRRLYWWVERCMRDPATNLYQDHISTDGSTDGTIWSYNQGSMVGAALRLYQLTGNPDYLARAERTAVAAFAYFDDTRLASEPPYFAAIYFRNLLALEAVTGGTTYRDAIRRYADRAWSTFRDTRTGLFKFRGGSRPTLLEQASMVQIYALLAAPRPDLLG
jgi:uncharacterized protein YyaL (SSP411 family)